MISIAIWLALFVVFVVYFYRQSFHCNLPGPWGLPFIGYVPFFTNNPHLSKIYGNVFQVRMGTNIAVILNGKKTIEEALNLWPMSGRPHLPTLEFLKESRITFADPSMPRWFDYRKAALRAVNSFTRTTNTNQLDHCIVLSLEHMKKEFDKWDNTNGADPLKVVFYAVNSVSATLTFGMPLPPDHFFLKIFWHVAEESSENVFGQQSVIDLFPVLQPLLGGRINEMKKLVDKLDAVAYEKIDSHQYEPEGPYLLDQIVDELQRSGYKDKPIMSPDAEKRYVARDIFFASSQTITDNLMWGIRVLGALPEVQQKLRTAIAHLSEDEAREHPMVKSFVHEVMRYAANFPLNLPHWTTDKCMLNGYLIPKNCLVFTNFYSVLFDPQIFPNPKQFIVDRFVTSDGEFDVNLASNVWVFSVGKRKCIGESLAKLELVAFTVGIVKNYKIGIRSFEGTSPCEATTGALRRTKPAKMTFERL